MTICPNYLGSVCEDPTAECDTKAQSAKFQFHGEIVTNAELKSTNIVVIFRVCED